MDIIFDSYTVEHKIENTITAGGLIPRISRSGPATTLLNSAAQIIKILLKKEGSLTFSLSNRGSRKISVSINGELLTNNMFSLSTGQTSILNMFLSLLRDSDLSQTRALPIDEIRGIVIIDEIDLHAHSDLQFSTLPSLISLFKNVQFIITSHSPLFLMGMKNTFGDKNFDIFDMPSGESVDVEKFSEFEVAYHHFKETNRFSDDIKSQLYQNQKPILYVEGTIDIDYIVKAGELLNKSDVIDKFDIRDGNGSGGLNKIYQRFDTELSKIIPQKVIILYDCDTEKLNSQKGNVYIRRIDREEGKISIGIENLFPDSTIIRVKDFNPQFVDVVAEHINLVRGSYKTVREQWCINKDEKRNMCNWLMQNGCAEDFLRFDKIIHELENIISNKDF